jgi:hypothetical protein
VHLRKLLQSRCVPSSRFHTTEESVDTLARLAAYSIRVAHEIDSQYVDGLDVVTWQASQITVIAGFDSLTMRLFIQLPLVVCQGNSEKMGGKC